MPHTNQRAEAERDRDPRAMRRWADLVVKAWLARKSERFTWTSANYWWGLDAWVEGRDIISGETLVTRANDGFLALVNGKLYRERLRKMERDLIVEALARKQVPHTVVRPPFSSLGVDALDIERWYNGWRIWDRLDADGKAARYARIAEYLVGAFVGDTGRWGYNDGYVLADGWPDHVTCWAECLAARATAGTAITLLSSKRYPVGSSTRSLRDAIRTSLGRRGIPVRELRAITSGWAMSRDLVAAWEANPLTLVV